MMFNGTNAFLIKTILYFANNTSYNESETITASPEVKTNTLYQLEKGEGEVVGRHRVEFYILILVIVLVLL